jgi:hypothetical protein
VDKPLRLFYLRSCPGANPEAGFFAINTGDIRNFGVAAAPWGPGRAILADARFFFAMPGP